MLDKIPVALIYADAEGKIEYANKAAISLFGKSEKELSQKNLFPLLPEADRAKIEELFHSGEELSPWTGDIVLPRNDGQDRTLKLNITLDSPSEMKVQRWVFMFLDVTELRLMERHMQQAQKLEAIGLLASGLAHNINSPLTAIIMTAEMAKLKAPDIPEFDDILQATNRITDIVGNLLYKSRQEQSTEEIDIDINDLIDTELKFLQSNLFFKHSVTKTVELEDNIPSIKGYYGDFSQSIQNLLSNALDAMDDLFENHLIVRTRFDKKTREIVILVGDSGCGIAEENLSRIFEPFYTTKTDTGSLDRVKPSGTGLGLSTVKRVLKGYGATVEVKSKVGEGSEFTVKIPLDSQISLENTNSH